jgi:hypothetical protein
MNHRQRAIDLVTLAADPRTPEHEASAAALAACKLIQKEGLLLEHIAREEIVTLNVTFLILTESGELYRLAKITPPRLQSDKVLLIPKEYVRSVTMMTSAETKRIGWKGSRIIKRISIVKSYFDTARESGWDDCN